ncbi:MAG: polysaccharide biosynthesis tyrosine autokinase [Tepidisphaeraceae bacterium]
MSQDMLPTRMNGGFMPPYGPGQGGYGLTAPEDPWGQPMMFPAPGGAGGAGAPVSPFKKMHRLLRGRYVLAFILAGIGALAGAVAGYLSQKPGFASNGLIEINPIIDTVLQNERVMLMYNTFVQNQIALIYNDRVISEALTSEEWRSTNRGNSPAVKGAFVGKLEARHVPNTSYIRVTFTDNDPRVAPQAVKAVIQAYQAIFGNTQAEENRRKLNALDVRLANLRADMSRRQSRIANLASAFGTEDAMAVFHKAKLEDLVRLNAQLSQHEFTLEALSGMVDEKGQPKRAVTDEEITQVDVFMKGLFDQKQSLELQIERNLITYGANHNLVVTAKRNLEILNRQIARYGDTFRNQGFQVVPTPDGGAHQKVSQETIATLRARVESLRKRYNEDSAEVNRMAGALATIETERQEIEKSRQEEDSTKRRIETLTFEYAGSGRLTIRSYGDTPLAPSVDKRKQMALLGFVGGGALPVCLLLAVGLLDSRYRYSDDAGTDLAGVPLLGILPNLPDLLTDPEQAAIAAHCVHQIRTMLQINSEAHDRKCFAVTSPSPGDGKTSLSLALGLSFAASGSRTLLIDGDMVGAGLTSRMNMTSPEGILEAINNRKLLPYVQTTDIANLSMLPVGAAQAHHSSMVAPAVVRKLIAEAKEHFDVVLIDTGPVLGSIESSPVASAADGVVLVVARGQQRPLVEKALAHLMAIGARLAGVVFNRAQSKDFEQSVSRLSMRSIARTNGNGHNAAPRPGEPRSQRLGPVAKAVQSSMNPAGAGTASTGTLEADRDSD